MLIYLDTAIVIYVIEGNIAFKSRARARLAAAQMAGDHIASSHLTRAECLVLPLRKGDGLLEADYRAFLGQTLVLNHPAAVFDLMSNVRAATNLKIPDALHIATAMHGKCDLFLTNDNRLAGFAGIKIEVLP